MSTDCWWIFDGRLARSHDERGDLLLVGARGRHLVPSDLCSKFRLGLAEKLECERTGRVILMGMEGERVSVLTREILPARSFEPRAQRLLGAVPAGIQNISL